MASDVTCPVCGETQRMRKGAKYCSNLCRQKAYTKRKQEGEKLAMEFGG